MTTNQDTNDTAVKIPKANEQVAKAKPLEAAEILKKYKDDPAECVAQLKKSAKESGYIEEKEQEDTSAFARSLDEFKRPAKGASNENELLKHRFLCRGGGLLLVGQSYIGKSSLAMQCMIRWALGQSCFGIEPARPLKSLLIQAENDDDDLGDMANGVFDGLNLSPEQKEQACENIHVICENTKRGGAMLEHIESVVRQMKLDLLWIDPALAYMPGDSKDAKDVGNFLRGQVAPFIKKHNCGSVILHHTNKITSDPDKLMTDPMYLGAGSAEWTNWHRAMLVLKKVADGNLCELIAAKRGHKLKWKTEDGESLTFTKYISQSKHDNIICWMDVSENTAQEIIANSGNTIDDVLKHIPQDAMVGKEEHIKTCMRNKIAKHKASRFINELVEAGRLFEVPVKRQGAKSKMLLSRTEIVLAPNTTMANLVANSQGHYIAPRPTTAPLSNN
jgi:hypothetical protein